MEQLIFFGILIFFSILESVSRSRKAKEQARILEESGSEPGGRDEDNGWEPQTPTTLTTTTRTEDPRIADPERKPIASGEAAYRTVPADVWLEIERLSGRTLDTARAVPESRSASPVPRALQPAPRGVVLKPDSGRTSARGVVQASRAVAPAPRAVATTPISALAPVPTAQHFVHLSHAGYGTDPSTRAPSEQDGLDPLRRTLSDDVREVRESLAHGRIHDLRRAMILHEVLGPPAGMRNDRADDD